ncbi:hypothetical protein MRX96_058600 [Rhipicephalus microplus]
MPGPTYSKGPQKRGKTLAVVRSEVRIGRLWENRTHADARQDGARYSPNVTNAVIIRRRHAPRGWWRGGQPELVRCVERTRERQMVRGGGRPRKEFRACFFLSFVSGQRPYLLLRALSSRTHHA